MKMFKDRPLLTFTFGAFYGLILGFLAFMCCGFGHGTYIPLAFTSAPLGIFGFFPALIGSPVVWGFLTLLVFKKMKFDTQIIVLIVMVLHYSVAIFLISGDWGGWEYVLWVGRTEGGFTLLVSWTFLFIVGEAFIWYCYCRNLVKKPG